MGFLNGIFKPKKQKKKFQQRRTPEERLILREDRYLEWLKKNDFATYRDMMQQKIQKGLGIKPTKEEDNLTLTLRTLHQLREAKLIDDPRTAGEEDWWKDLAKGLAPVLGMLLVNQQAQRPAALPEPAPLSVPPPVVESFAPAMPDVERRAVRKPVKHQEPEPEEEDEEMSMVSWFLISQLDKKTPEEAAAWLMSQSRQEAKDFVKALLATPLDQLPALMATIQEAAPQLSGFIGWLRNDRPQWFIQTVQVIKVKVSVEASAPISLDAKPPAPKSVMGF